MRAPVSAMLPLMLGVSIFTRGPAAIAEARLWIGAAEAGVAGAPACWPGAAGVAPGAVVAGVAGLAACFCASSACCAARCFSICGML